MDKNKATKAMKIMVVNALKEISIFLKIFFIAGIIPMFLAVIILLFGNWTAHKVSTFMGVSTEDLATAVVSGLVTLMFLVLLFIAAKSIKNRFMKHYNAD